MTWLVPGKTAAILRGGGNILTYTCLCILHDRWGHQSTGTEWTVHPYPQIQLVSPCLSVPACCIHCSRKFTCCVLLHLNSLVLVNLFRGWFYIEANAVALAVCSRLGLRQWVILWWLMHRLSNLSEIENLIAGLWGFFFFSCHSLRSQTWTLGFDRFFCSIVCTQKWTG